jgi:hypothetical protein
MAYALLMATTSQLAAQTSGVDEALRRALQEQVDLLELEKPKMSEQIQRLLRTLLRARVVHRGGRLLMGMRRRTLARHSRPKARHSRSENASCRGFGAER